MMKLWSIGIMFRQMSDNSLVTQETLKLLLQTAFEFKKPLNFTIFASGHFYGVFSKFSSEVTKVNHLSTSYETQNKI